LLGADTSPVKVGKSHLFPHRCWEIRVRTQYRRPDKNGNGAKTDITVIVFLSKIITFVPIKKRFFNEEMV
jgi:hypothetical protein